MADTTRHYATLHMRMFDVDDDGAVYNRVPISFLITATETSSLGVIVFDDPETQPKIPLHPDHVRLVSEILTKLVHVAADIYSQVFNRRPGSNDNG